jgi:glutathione S-transferase
MSRTTLTLNSKNYGAWSLRGWLLVKFSGLEFEEIVVPATDCASRAQLLLLSPSTLVPRLVHEGATIWDTLAIAEYLNEVRPEVRLKTSWVL